MKTVILLVVSNIFMTFAWYGHLRYRTTALWLAVLASWGIAFFEYCFQVPANRIGAAQRSSRHRSSNGDFLFSTTQALHD